LPEQVGKHFILVGDERRVGGLSHIRKAVDIRDASQVAVKFVDGNSDELTRKVFERETQALRKLSHPNIVRFRDSGIDEVGRYYVVLDWVERSLVELLKDPPWNNWAEFYRSIAAPLLDGLAYAHLHRVQHRDIKPANILIANSGAPLLADFGIAKQHNDEFTGVTVQNFRSGPYAPPEQEATLPYVRDTYGIGVVILQCLSDAPIKDFPDIQRALEAIRVPAEIRKLLEACVSPEPTERPANGRVLADEFRQLVRDGIADAQKPLNAVWLDLTRTAQEHLAGTPPDRTRAATKMKEDLAGTVFAHFGTDRETGEVDRSRVFLIGDEHRYSLKRDDESPKFVVVAAPAPEFELLEGGRRHGLELPPIFSWVSTQPADVVAADRGRQRLHDLLDDFARGEETPEEGGADSEGEALFEKWLRLLEAREDLARGEHEPLQYKKARSVGRRNTFELTNPCEADLIGTAWQIVDPQSGRKFGHGEVIEQDSDELVFLSPRALGSLPPAAKLEPYDAPSAIALGRQRNALVAVQNSTSASPDLRRLILDPSCNAEPQSVSLENWSEALDHVQKRAVEQAMGAQELLVIQGPPGTGKTRFITETVKQLLRRSPDSRVLIASQTHVAVDNAVERLHAAGVNRIVRLAGADDSVVQPAVREFLLDAQTAKWAAKVRARAEAHIASRAKDLGLETTHLRAVLALEQLSALAQDYEAVEERLAKLAPSSASGPTDLVTAIEEENPAESLQARLDHLADRCQELSRVAQTHLAGDLTLPELISSSEARSAIDVLIGDNAGARQLVKRVGLQALWLDSISAEDSLASLFLAGTSVVAGTCTGFLRNKAVGQLEFDVCIIDEASKATLTEAIVPMSRAKRWILVGDTRQLPPIDEDLRRRKDLLEEHNLSSEDVTETLFQRLVEYLPDHSQLALTEQYRMIRPIGDLISNCFYANALRSPNANGLDGYDLVMGRAVTWIDTTSLGEGRREFGTQSYANRGEARIIMEQLKTIDAAIERRLIKIGSDEKRLEVLVIASYKSQVDELRRRVAVKSFKHLHVSVMSVDSVQGREADLAFFSVTRSNPRHELGFLGPDYWRRINVALSRARFGLTIVGDAAFIRGTKGALKTVLEYAESHPDDCVVRPAANV
jgi:hypothetical protein